MKHKWQSAQADQATTIEQLQRALEIGSEEYQHIKLDNDRLREALVKVTNSCYEYDYPSFVTEALEQPTTQKPYAWVMVNRNPDHQDIYFLPTKPTREQKISHQPYELYTHPKEWQGLSDDEIGNLIRNKLIDKIEITVEDILDILLEQQDILERKNK